jgi:hypothetical protein
MNEEKEKVWQCDQNNKVVGKVMLSSSERQERLQDDSALHPLFSSLKELSSARSDSTFLAIAHMDDETKTTKVELLDAGTIIEPPLPFTRRSTRHSVMRPTDREEARRKLRDQTSPFISRRIAVQKGISNQHGADEISSTKEDSKTSEVELSALVKMWKGTRG